MPSSRVEGFVDYLRDALHETHGDKAVEGFNAGLTNWEDNPVAYQAIVYGWADNHLDLDEPRDADHGRVADHPGTVCRCGRPFLGVNGLEAHLDAVDGNT